ncbi:beta-glucosidase [Tritrichomonas foetus]|uniref:beta-glucosidase n=1 Tax=Tritrichomonas foetus TaxID=1144522 RepID=A0A1J4KB54_9EUKA|nr:beta-glucosidase [Tritrichomonas foetus]|eukprot:OHT08451.1 beta-glucosidase [Tritrichomonas foetus]
MQNAIEKDGYCLLNNPNNGPTLGFSKKSGITIKEKDGLYFKNLSRTDDLVPYEDWRLDCDTRAKDLASRLSIEQIAGLMLYSKHQMVPNPSPEGYFGSSYGGKPFNESGYEKWALTDQQKTFLEIDGIRHVLGMTYESGEIAARWNNEMQQFVECLPFGIPVNTSSDPRHGAHGVSSAEYRVNGDTSKWPEGLGMSATFDPEICHQFSEIMQTEYRALGITTALSPQADLATEPRWMRAVDTFGPHTELATDMTRAYCEGLQETKNGDEKTGWGNKSVIAMVKHWPGGGTGESGRDAHYVFGKYAVYPGNNFEEHLKPFLNGAFNLDGSTKKAGAVMPYYTVSWNQDPKENVGNSYSHYIIHDLLRTKYGYDGVVCTDWGITDDEANEVDFFGSRCFGVENLSVAERHMKIIMNGVDQFGGNNDAKPIVEAYKIGCERYGKDVVDQHYRNSARRLLRGIFRVGLFENPYIDPLESAKTVGHPDFLEAGYKAQLKSIVLLKNHANALPLRPVTPKLKVYIPIREVGPTVGFFRNVVPGYTTEPVPKSIVAKYFDQVDKAEDADFAIVYIEAPLTNHYSKEDREKGGNGYLPTSLQYRPYTATSARDPSIAGGDPLESSNNRSHKGKTVVASNEKDLNNIIETRKRLGNNKKLIVVCYCSRSVIPAEFEKYVDAFIVHFGVQPDAIFETITGKSTPSALLPIQLPADMETVEKHCEDVAFDMTPYVDSDGHAYDFGFGLSFDGVISDERTKRYHK